MFFYILSYFECFWKNYNSNCPNMAYITFNNMVFFSFAIISIYLLNFSLLLFPLIVKGKLYVVGTHLGTCLTHNSRPLVLGLQALPDTHNNKKVSISMCSCMFCTIVVMLKKKNCVHAMLSHTHASWSHCVYIVLDATGTCIYTLYT